MKTRSPADWLLLAFLIGFLLAAAGLAFCDMPPVSVSIPEESR